MTAMIIVGSPGGKPISRFLDRHGVALERLLGYLWHDIPTRQCVRDGQRFAYQDIPLVAAANPVPARQREKAEDHECGDSCLLLTVSSRPSRPERSLHLDRGLDARWTLHAAKAEDLAWPKRVGPRARDGWLEARTPPTRPGDRS